MKIRLYHPRVEAATQDAAFLKVHPTLKGARAVANAIATTGRACEIWRYIVEGPDTEVVVALLNAFGAGDHPGKDVYWTPDLYEVHRPTDQIPVPGENGAFPYEVVVEREGTEDDG